MARLDTSVVTSLKPYRQRHSFQFRTYFFATLGLLVAVAALAFANRLASPQRRGSILGRREQRSLHFFRRCCLWMFRLPTHRRSDSRAPTGVIEEHQLLDRSWVHFAIFA